MLKRTYLVAFEQEIILCPVLTDDDLSFEF